MNDVFKGHNENIINERTQIITDAGFEVMFINYDERIHETMYTVRCKNSHYRTFRFGSFYPYCNSCKDEDNERLKIKDFEEHGFTYIKKEKVGTNLTYFIKCINGHIKTSTFANWKRSNKKCKDCEKKITEAKLIEKIESYGFKINKFPPKINTDLKFEVIDESGYKYSATPISIFNEANLDKWNVDYIKENFENLFYNHMKSEIKILDIENLNDRRDKLLGIDNNGYKYLINVFTVIYSNSEPNWLYSNPFALENINRYCELNRSDYMCLDNRYIDNRTPLKFKYIGKIPSRFKYFNREFKMDLSHFMRGQGHPLLNASKGESSIKNYLRKYNVDYVYQHKFEDCRNILALEFDFMLQKDGLVILIEYDGKQHFKSIEQFGGEEAFIKNKEKDMIKNDYCINNNIPLIRIPYWEYRNIEYLIEHLLYYFNFIECDEGVNKQVIEKYTVDSNWNHEKYLIVPKVKGRLVRNQINASYN